MKVTQEETRERQATLNIEMDSEEMEGYLNRAYRKVVQRTNIPGFRKGKAPRHIVERYVGRELLLNEAIDLAIPEATSKALAQEALEAAALPQVEVVQLDPVILKATVPLTPVVELGDYRSLRLEEEAVEVTTEEVEEILEQLRSHQAPWEPVERPVQYGDMVTMSLEGRVKDRVIVDDKDVSYVPREGSGVPVPGFPEQLVGISKGDEKRFTLFFPEDYQNADLAGQECLFTVTVSEVKEKRLPDLDDEFAKGVGEGYDTLEGLKEKVKIDLWAEKEAVARRRYQGEMVEALLQQATLEIPPLVVEHELDHLVGEEERSLQRAGASMEAYLEKVGKSPQELRDELRERAVARLKHNLVLSKVMELEGIQVTSEEIDREVESLSKGSRDQEGAVRDLFTTPQGRDSVARMLLTRRTLERLEQIFKGEAPPLETREEVAVAQESGDELSRGGSEDDPST